MKYTFTVVLMLSLAVSSAFAQYQAVGKVKNSLHDLSSGSTATVKSSDFNQICAFCHVAHKGATAPAGVQTPLWNHTLTSTNFSTSYSSSTFTPLGTGITALGAGTWSSATTSHLCLSCHDGTVGVNSVYKFATPTVGAIASHTDASSRLLSNANLGTDMSSSHPVNFLMDQTTWTIKNTHIVGVNATTHATTGTTALPLDSNNKLQCATCHQVHDPTNTYFLRDSLTGSAICLDCHLNT